MLREGRWVHVQTIPFLKPPFGTEEQAAVCRVLETAAISKGEECDRFEEEFARYMRRVHAKAVCNGSVALDAVLQSYKHLGQLLPGDKVYLPSFTFVAVANAVVNAGLTPIFGEVRPDDYNLTPAIPEGVRAVILPHTFGCPADMDEWLAHTEGKVLLIEDCAEACGAEFKGKPAGSFGDAATFSFNATKNLTTGEGGMIVTDDGFLHQLVSQVVDHGIAPNPSPALYRAASLPGHNFRMSNITAAIGRVQLGKLEHNNRLRWDRARALSKSLQCKRLQPQLDNHGRFHSYQLYTLRLESPCDLRDRDKVVVELRRRGIEARVYFYPPIHRHPFYRQLSDVTARTPSLNSTDSLSQRVFSLPLYPGLDRDEIEYMVDNVSEVSGCS